VSCEIRGNLAAAAAAVKRIASPIASPRAAIFWLVLLIVLVLAREFEHEDENDGEDESEGDPRGHWSTGSRTLVAFLASDCMLSSTRRLRQRVGGAIKRQTNTITDTLWL
jgi:hypothetical protein